MIKLLLAFQLLMLGPDTELKPGQVWVFECVGCIQFNDDTTRVEFTIERVSWNYIEYTYSYNDIHQQEITFISTFHQNYDSLLYLVEK